MGHAAGAQHDPGPLAADSSIGHRVTARWRNLLPRPGGGGGDEVCMGWGVPQGVFSGNPKASEASKVVAPSSMQEVANGVPLAQWPAQAATAVTCAQHASQAALANSSKKSWIQIPDKSKGKSWADIHDADAGTAKTQSEMPAARKKRASAKSLSHLQDFDIDPARIQSGEDTRTTVMLRNVPKSCSQETLFQLIEQHGLQDRITCFYMPVDRCKNVHSGFAFFNLLAPEDVLVMLSILQRGIFNGSVRGNTMRPALSYARLQGHEKLLGQFTSTAALTSPRQEQSEPCNSLHKSRVRGRVFALRGA